MENIGSIIKNKKIERSKSGRPVNILWESAREFGEYVNLSTPFVLRLFKIYGQQEVLNLKAWLKDCNYDPERYAGLVVWKLKQAKIHVLDDKKNSSWSDGSDGPITI